MDQGNNQLQFKTLTVQSVETKDNRVTVKAGDKSFSFFQTKRSGEPSRAQNDFLKLGVRAGQTYSFGVAEKQGTNSNTGQPITFRNIGCISEVQEQPQQNVPTTQPYVPTPPAPTATNTPPVPAPPQSHELQALSDRLTSLENRVALLDSSAEIDTAKIPPLEKGNEELDDAVENIPF